MSSKIFSLVAVPVLIFQLPFAAPKHTTLCHPSDQCDGRRACWAQAMYR